MEVPSKHLVPNSDFALVQGTLRSMIYDFSENRLIPVPNSMMKFLDSLSRNSLEEVRAEFEAENSSGHVESYIQFLKAHQLVIPSDVQIPLRRIDFDYESVYDIEVLVVEVESEQDLMEVLKYSSSLSVMTFVVVLSIPINSIASVIQALYSLSNSSINSLEIVLEWEDEFDLSRVKMLEKHPKFKRITFFNADRDATYNDDGIITVYTRSSYHSEAGVAPMNFLISVELCSEARNHNAFYNRKVFIDTSGNVSNMKGTPVLFELSELENAVKNGEMAEKSFWNVKKDDTKVCKDCEFRYACIDSRVPVFDSKSQLYTHSTSCNYNPNEGVWNDLTEVT